MGQTLSICLEKRKTLKEKELRGMGKGLHFYRFRMFHVIPLGYKHYIETNPSILSSPAASCIVSWQHWNPRLITPCMPSPGFSALERGGWLLVSKGWEMALCQHVSALEHAVTHAHPRFLRAGAGVSCPAAEGQTPVQSGHCSVSEDWPASLTSVETSNGHLVCWCKCKNEVLPHRCAAASPPGTGPAHSVGLQRKYWWQLKVHIQHH